MAVKRYDGTAWQVVAGKGDQGTSSSISTWVKTATGGETSVSGNDDNSQPLSYTVGQELVFINGALQKRGADYTATTGNSITGLTALAANDVVTVWTVNAFSVTGAIANTIVDAKGDLIVATGADTPGKLTAGTTGQVLTVDSTTGTGLKWATPGAIASNYTLLNTGGTALTGAATITVSGISGMEKLHIIVDSASSANASSAMSIRINTDSGTNYYYGGIKWKADSTEYMLAELTNSYRTNTDSIYLGAMGSNAAMQMGISLFIDGGTSTGGKGFIGQGGRSGTQGGTTGVWTAISGVYLGSAAITSISILSSSGNFDNGTIYVYGSAA